MKVKVAGLQNEPRKTAVNTEHPPQGKVLKKGQREAVTNHFVL